MTAAGIPATIRQSLAILATHRGLFGGRRREGVMGEDEIIRVLQVFTACGARWALIGAHAIGLVTEPRATADFDFIIDDTALDRVVEALAVEFGDLEATDRGAALQLRAIDVDLIRSANHALFERALVEVRTLGDWRIPRTEVLVVLKFLAATNPLRNRNKRRMDVVDLAAMVEAVGHQLEHATMLDLARLVYPGAEHEFAELLGKLERGEPVAI